MKMVQLSCNIKHTLDLFKSRRQSFPVGIKDLAGWIFCLGVLLAVAAWKLAWVENLVTSILSIIILLGAAVSVTARPISQIVFRGEPRNDSEWARFHKQN